MEKIMIDARGCACPEPVLKTKRALTTGPSAITVMVDNNTAVENIKRFAGTKGYQVHVTENNGDFKLEIKK